MSSDLKVTNIKHESSSSNNLVLGSDGNVSITNTISAGTIGDAVDFPQTGYAQLKLTSNATTQGELTWGSIIGDTTNITQSGSDITLVKAGVYFITFSVNGLGSSPQPERQLYISIRQSSDDSTLASARDSTGNFDSATNYGNAVATLVKAVSANYEINFYFESLQDATADLYLDTHASIVLIKPA